VGGASQNYTAWNKQHSKELKSAVIDILKEYSCTFHSHVSGTCELLVRLELRTTP